MINRIPYSIHLFRVSYSLTETFDRTQSFRLSACLHLCTIDGAFFITFGTLEIVGLHLLLVFNEDHFSTDILSYFDANVKE